MTTTINAAATSKPSNLGQDRELTEQELDELREEELQKVSGGYIGETEKNISHGKTTF
jgi:bacteriocin-like protein